MNETMTICGKRVKKVANCGKDCNGCALQDECFLLKAHDSAPFCEDENGERNSRFEFELSKDEMYYKLVCEVQANFGYIILVKPIKFNIFAEYGVETFTARAIMYDNFTHQLWLIDENFERWDIDDYLNETQLYDLLSVFEKSI